MPADFTDSADCASLRSARRPSSPDKTMVALKAGERSLKRSLWKNV